MALWLFQRLFENHPHELALPFCVRVPILSESRSEFLLQVCVCRCLGPIAAQIVAKRKVPKMLASCRQTDIEVLRHTPRRSFECLPSSDSQIALVKISERFQARRHTRKVLVCAQNHVHIEDRFRCKTRHCRAPYMLDRTRSITQGSHETITQRLEHGGPKGVVIDNFNRS